MHFLPESLFQGSGLSCYILFHMQSKLEVFVFLHMYRSCNINTALSFPPSAQQECVGATDLCLVWKKTDDDNKCFGYSVAVFISLIYFSSKQT